MQSVTQRTNLNQCKTLLKAILRESAQPVAVVTSPLRPHKPSSPFHGATLSSFTSIAMDPFPVVSFALRVPSRMAVSLKHLYHNPREVEAGKEGEMVINILSARQHHAALVFSRPDLYPHPFAHDPTPPSENTENEANSLAALGESSSLIHHSTLRIPTEDSPPPPTNVPYHLSSSGIPILNGSLGAFTCRLLVPGLPLHDTAFLESIITSSSPTRTQDSLRRDEDTSGPEGVVSELFIAQVTKIELPWREDRDAQGGLPLVYHRRGFTTCQ